MKKLEKSVPNFPLPVAKPEEVGVSSKNLGLLHSCSQKYIDSHKVPNLITLVARHGKIVYYEAQGYMDSESHKPIQKDTICRLWSNSKPIAGVATMLCVQEGLLSLDDPVSRFIPAFKNPVVRVDEVQYLSRSLKPLNASPTSTYTVPAEREITIRDCLCNTTGLVTPQTAPLQYLMEYKDIIQDSGLLTPPNKEPDDMRKTVEALAHLPLDAQPGTKFVYRAGYPIISLIIPMVTGMSLEDFYQERIFEPLGMIDSSFYLPENKLDRFSTCYWPVQEGNRWKLAVMDRPETSEKVKGTRIYCNAGGARGGVLSTVSDYARFTQMLLNGGELEGERILSRKSVEIMTSSHTGDVYVTMPGPPGYGFGLGVGVYKGGGFPGLRSIGTYGWTGAGGTCYFADPEEDLICIIFTQVFAHWVFPDSLFQDELERLVYQALI
jgi:CubicO group peptidase (beta-lactamase class C family)